MVAAVASGETPAEKKKDGGNVQNYGGLPPAEKVKVVRKTRTMEITSRYKSATTAASPSAAPAVGRRNPSPMRQPSPSLLRQPSPVRNRLSSGSGSISGGASDGHVRHPSPNLGRSSSSNAPEVAKRALSAERRRPWPATGPSEGKSPPGASEGVAKARVQTRAPELWPSMAVAKVSVEGNGENASEERGREGLASSQAGNQTLKPAGNGVHRAGENVSGTTPPRKGSPMRRQSLDQSENARPTENSHPKPEHQRWPGMSTGKVFSGAMSRSVDLRVDKERPQMARSSSMVGQGRPGTPSSRSAKATISRTLNRSVSNEGAVSQSGQAGARRSGTPTRGRTGTTESSGREAAGNGSGNGNGNGNSEGEHVRSNATGTGDNAGHARRLSQDSVATVDSVATGVELMSDSESVSSAGSGGGTRLVRGTTVPSRVWQDMNNRLRRFSEGDRNRTSDASEQAAVVIAPVKTVRRAKVAPHQSAVSLLMNQSMNQSSNGGSGWAMSPGRVSGNLVSSNPHPPSSPSHAKGSSPLRGLASPQRARPVPGSAAALAGTARAIGSTTINFGIDGRSRGKRSLTQQEEAQLLRILHNRWLQWRFVNARAEAVTSAQKAAAERQLYNVWLKTSELRTSVAMQRIKLQQARQAHKLRSILSTHATHLENWESLEEEHSNALTGCMEALESAILRVPVTGGARADVHAVKEALNSAVDVMNAVEGSVQFLLPKTQSMEALLSQLAETAAQERALLEECGDLLSVAASLEVEERSLRTHLIQLESERQRLFKAEPMNGALNTSYLLTP